MATFTIKENSKQAKALIAMLKTLDFVEFKEEEKSPYKPEFVKMVKKAAQSKNRTRINPKNVWESI